MLVQNMTVHAVKYTLEAINNVNAAATTQTLSIPLPGNGYLLNIQARVRTAFAGVTGPSVAIGDTTKTDLYILDQAIGSIRALLSNSGGQCVHPELGSNVSTPDIKVTFTSSAGNLSSLTAGKLEVIVLYVY